MGWKPKQLYATLALYNSSVFFRAGRLPGIKSLTSGWVVTGDVGNLGYQRKEKAVTKITGLSVVSGR